MLCSGALFCFKGSIRAMRLVSYDMIKIVIGFAVCLLSSFTVQFINAESEGNGRGVE